jgi:HSP20 family protein
MAIPTRWTPVNPLGRLDRLLGFEDFLRGLGGTPTLSREYERVMDMRLDVHEDEKSYLVNVDIPGVKKKDIAISVEGNQVTVRAQVTREKSRDNDKEIYSERYSGEAYRSFSLPTEIDDANAKATYDGGVLTLSLPKKIGASAKRLAVE